MEEEIRNKYSVKRYFHLWDEIPSGSWKEAAPCHREFAVTQNYFKGWTQTSGIFPSSMKAAGFEEFDL